MSTGSHRAVEIAIGLALDGYCAYAIYSGRIMGRFRWYSRSEEPGTFWTSIVLTFGFSLLFLFGFVSWRN